MPNDETPPPNGGIEPDRGRAVLEHALGRVLWELRPYLAEVVVIGGWVPYLYRRYGPFPSWRAGDGLLSLTAEADVLLTRDLPPAGRQPVADLLRGAGFQPVTTTGLAAVWANDPARGEKIEFMVPHAGTLRDVGRVVPIGAQREVGAVALDRLDVLQRHTRTLGVPAVAPDGARRLAAVRVPRLGAYVLNKAATFLYRQPVAGGGGNPKQAKDLLYLRDLMYGGAEVVDVVERDLAEILAADSSAQHIIDLAANNLDGAVRPSSSAVTRLQAVAAMLVEREPAWQYDAAVANVAGHLTDLRDILVAFRSPDPSASMDPAHRDRDRALDGPGG